MVQLTLPASSLSKASDNKHLQFTWYSMTSGIAGISGKASLRGNIGDLQAQEV